MHLEYIAIFSILLISLFYLNFRFISHISKIDEFTFNLSLSLIFTLGLLQTTSLWFMLISSKPITSSSTLTILTILALTSALVTRKYLKGKVNHRFSLFDSILSGIPISTAAIASLSTFFLGDSGWDSNAYHIPLIGILMEWGSNSWPNSLSEGTFTIYTPYGVHALQAQFVAILSDFRTASIPTAILFIGGALLATSLVTKKTSKIILILAISITPSVFGQLSRNYVDVWAGIYLFSGIVVYFKMAISKKTPEINKALFFISAFILGLSASTKTQTLISSILCLLVITSITVKQNFKKSIEIGSLANFFAIFFLSSIVPYLRNLIFENNPIFPITSTYFSKGTISISELSEAVSNFRPNFWPPQSIADPVLSLLTPIWVLCILMLSKIGIYLDSTRLDISAFTYDTTTGGPGMVTSIVILSACCISLYRLVKNRKIPQLRHFNEDILLTIFAIIVFISIPGAWYPRYGMALYFLLLLIAVRYLEKFNSSSLVFLLIIGAGIPSILGLVVFQKYDQYSNQRNAYFNPKYSLDSPPQEFSRICKKVAILEPRPTFTSFIWEAKCDLVTSLPSDTKIFPQNYFIVANHKIDSKIVGNRKYCLLRTWFDPTAIYGTYLYSSVSFKGSFCNPPQIGEKISKVKYSSKMKRENH
jgi:hypothetical protein